MKGLVAVLLLMIAVPVQAQPPPAKVFGLALGATGVWLDGSSFEMVSDVEAGLNARASLSDHISLVGSGAYGLDHQYVTAAGGIRITATDVLDRTFSVGVGIQYRWYDDLYQPKEWMPDASVGWRPWGAYSKLNLTGSGAYGLTTGTARATLGVRYAIY